MPNVSTTLRYMDGQRDAHDEVQHCPFNIGNFPFSIGMQDPLEAACIILSHAPMLSEVVIRFMQGENVKNKSADRLLQDIRRRHF